jgi:hypothetical protein
MHTSSSNRVHDSTWDGVLVLVEGSGEGVDGGDDFDARGGPDILVRVEC